MQFSALLIAAIAAAGSALAVPLESNETKITCGLAATKYVENDCPSNYSVDAEKKCGA
ncbi:hypothetical protein K402DRAFT_392218 [Aulographum hederae CBS 113979]|uniref:Uncharacterized protein n=1 Tax=Aulographum hederae CBS 113979 TaxID=1176131 RepID=A0A6G1H4I3_9PEZI|nr:hypothetical protein K402DRAFT_392218 [Aulographum hederae CBS 113979]